MTSTVLDSPTIFEKMLGIARVTGQSPPPPEKDTSQRYYFCKKEHQYASTYTCQKGSLEEIWPITIPRRGRLVALGAGCPEMFDQVRLARRLESLVSMGPPLTPK